MDRFLAEIDAGRHFEESGLIADILTYASREGFGPVMRHVGVAKGSESIFDNAARFRQRYVLSALGVKVE